ncbi:MAG TPA: GYF domain-containing protein [Lacunisphaera sp.]|nr:GYF domain-containing protein [Lacunisphaera sp.]
MKLSEDFSVRYVTKIGDQVGGPYSMEGLESLVYLKKINPETLVAVEGSADFAPIRETILKAKLFPGLMNKPASNTPQDWSRPGKENDPAEINRKRFRTAEAKFENINAKSPTKKVDVYEMLDEIRETEKAAFLDVPKTSRFKLSRRSLDFWFLIIVVNAVILGAAIAMQSTMSMVFGIGCSALFTFGLLWTMYGVMDKY